jgi:hypothetical protein
MAYGRALLGFFGIYFNAGPWECRNRTVLVITYI